MPPVSKWAEQACTHCIVCFFSLVYLVVKIYHYVLKDVKQDVPQNSSKLWKKNHQPQLNKSFWVIQWTVVVCTFPNSGFLAYTQETGLHSWKHVLSSVITTMQTILWHATSFPIIIMMTVSKSRGHREEVIASTDYYKGRRSGLINLMPSPILS